MANHTEGANERSPEVYTESDNSFAKEFATEIPGAAQTTLQNMGCNDAGPVLVTSGGEFGGQRFLGGDDVAGD